VLRPETSLPTTGLSHHAPAAVRSLLLLLSVSASGSAHDPKINSGLSEENTGISHLSQITLS
jgi:hypothetical protein